MVKLGIKSVDATDLVGVAGHVGSILGADIGKLLLDAAQNAAAIEALPLGERQVIAGLV
jgi:ABC-type xylose transport system permease subunit